MLTHGARAALAVASAVVALAACAPDTVTNRYATGFNAYLGQIATACKPLMIGTYDMTYQLQHEGIYDDNYNYFLDATSQLYYQRSTEADYRSAINGFFGGGCDDRPRHRLHHRQPAGRPTQGRAAAGRAHQRQLTRPSTDARSVRSRISSIAAVAPQMKRSP